MLRLTAIFGLMVLASAGDHPAVKIIALLQKLQAQVKEEGANEANAYGKFQYWCAELTKKTENELAKAKEEIAVAAAAIEGLTADIAALAEQIANDEAAKLTAEGKKTNATNDRNAAKAVYEKSKSDLEGTISAIASANTALTDSKFLQTGMSKAKKLLAQYAPEKMSLLQIQEDPEFVNRQGRERNYDFKSGDIIEMMKKMQLDFEDQLIQLNKDETAAVNAHKLADAAKEDEIGALSRSISTKNTVKSDKEGDKSDEETKKQNAETDRDTASTTLSQTKTTCKTRADEWAERSERRDGEIKAMQQACEVLEKVTGVRSPESKGISFVQLGMQRYPSGEVRKKIVNLLRTAAGNTKGTEALVKLANKIAALKQMPGSGVFDSIKNMIQKMIFHLMSEQKDEDDHEAWCSQELNQTEKMKIDKEDRRDAMQADMDQLTAEIQELTNGINDANDAVATWDSEIEAMTANRAEEKTENEATIKDAQDAQTAIAQAIAVLTDYYKSTGEVETAAWEFRQVLVRHHRIANLQEPEPALWEGGEGGRYKGTSGGSGVIGILEECAADFSSMESQADADETTQESEYQEDLSAAMIDKAQKQKDAEMQSARKDRKADKLESKTKDHQHTMTELDATVQYEKDLQRACVDGDSTYGERKAARTQEIDALHEAQKILDDAFKL